MYESLPKQSQKSLDAVLNQGTLSSKTYDSSLNRGPLPPRPATSHADRASLKQFIKDKKKEAKKTEILYPERPKSAAQGHERTNHDISGSVHSLKRSARAPDISFARPDSASSLTTVERRHAQQSSQDLKKAPRKQIDLTLEDPPISADVTRPAAMTPHAQRKAVRRPLERPESAVERPKSSGSGTATAPSRSVRPTNKPAVPTRPKTVASVSSSSTGTLSSAPKRPNFNRKALTTASTSSMHQIIDIPTDFTAETSNQTIPTHIAHIVTPPRLIQDLPLQVIQNPPDNITNRQPHSHAKDDPKPTPKDLPEFTHNKAIDARSINSGTLNVMASLLSDTSNQVPKDAFEILSIALDKGDSAVRRAGMDLGLALWGRVDDPIMFWSQLEGLREGTKNFLSYWINKG